MDRIIESISRFQSGIIYDDLPSDVVHAAKRTLVDTMGCAFGGYDTATAGVARAIAEAVCPVEGSRQASVLVDGAPTSPDLAAFANGVMLRVLDFNDSFHGKGNGGHPSDVIAGVLAVAESEHVDGASTLLGIVSAYEVFCRHVGLTGLGANPWDHVSATVLGVAGAASRLMGLSEDQLRHALTLAIVPNMALRATRFEELSMWKACAAANASRNGVFAAVLAAHDVSGPPRPFEGRGGAFSGPVPQFEPVPLGGDDGFAIQQCQFKRFPVCSLTQTAASAALEFHALGIDPTNIERIRLGTTTFAISVTAGDREKWRPVTRETADHSLPFVVASTVRDGASGALALLDGNGFTDSGLLALMDRIEVSADAECDAAAPVTTSKLEMTLTNGETHSATVKYHRGHYLNPMTDDELSQKYLEQAAPVIGEAAAEHLLEMLWDIDHCADVSEVLAATKRGPSS
jgi:2-methylcitrate dehydratase